CIVSCSSKQTNQDTPTPESISTPDVIIESTKSYTAEKLTGIAYKKEMVKLPEGMNQIYSFCTYNAGNNHFILGAGAKVPEFWTADRSLQNFEKIEIPDFDIGVSYNMDVAENGTVAEFFVDADYGDLPDPDPYSDDYNEALYDSVAEYSFKINTYSTDGKLLKSATVGEFPETPDKYVTITETASDGNLLIASVNGAYYIFRTDGTYIGELSADDGTVEAIGHNRDGSFVCAVSTDDNKLQILPIDSDGKTGKSSVTYDFSESIQDNITAGTGDYSMFMRSMSTIYGIRADNSAIEALFSINYAGLSSNNVQGYAMGEDGRFSVIDNNYIDPVRIRTYTQCSKEEYESIPRITVGAKYDDYLLKNYINTFNDTHDDMQIDIKLYEDEKGNEAFAKDMLDGNLPDVLLVEDSSGNFGNANLYKQGIICNLYDFIDSDGDISHESFIPNVIEALEIDDGLYAIPSYFTLWLRYTAKEKYVKDIETWDFNAYMDIIENLPEDMGIDRWKDLTDDTYDTKLRRSNCYNYMKWADFENNTCDYDNADFIRYLNYCNSAEIIDIEQDLFDPESLTDEDHNYRFKMQQRQYIDDLAMFNNVSVGSYASYLDLTQGEFAGEPIRTLGEIGNNDTPVILDFGGMNHYSIATTSDKKALAWNFIKNMISDEYYSENHNYGFPVTESGLKIQAEFDKLPQENNFIGMEAYKDYTGYLYYLGDGNYAEIGYVDDELIKTV
ncbi:MAG: hypothetical protein K2J39_08280, partial [Ruminococcus sp.]|nr:hypothetical protein [Ruminococcus sp.]